MKFKLTTQFPKPKPKVIGVGEIDISRDGEASFYVKNSIVANMVRARVEWMAVAGLYLNGMELVGYEKDGTPKYRYQEWFVAYIEEKP